MPVGKKQSARLTADHKLLSLYPKMRTWGLRAIVCIAVVAAQWGSSAFLYCQTAPSNRGLQQTDAAHAASIQPGPYYALVIGNNNYRYLTKLETPINDADELARLLRDIYGFQTTVLHDADRSQILRALNECRRTLPENSNLLIYYAGHGEHDRGTDKAYWLPVDAEKDNNANWILADDITSDLKAIPSFHILIVSDSCYSGFLTRDAEAAIEPRDRTRYLAKVLNYKSRTLMSSGGDEPVADGGAPGHSVFAAVILDSLRQIDEDNFTAAELAEEYVKRRVGGRSGQLPHYSGILASGDDGGDFVFFRRSSSAGGFTSAASGAAVAGGSLAMLPVGLDASLAETYRKALAGDSGAMVDVGLAYEEGKGAHQDYKQAVSWYRKGADAGNAKGMRGVGYMYGKGLGVTQDYQEALKWYRKAADAGDAEGMRSVGVIYGNGYGVSKDYGEALKWFRKAADAGDASGISSLGAMYENGYGVEKDLQQALTLYQKAANLGDQYAKDQLKRLGKTP